jgi:hypothetical protein
LGADRLIKFQQIDDSNYYYLSHESLIEVIRQSYLVLFKNINQTNPFVFFILC